MMSSSCCCKTRDCDSWKPAFPYATESLARLIAVHAEHPSQSAHTAAHQSDVRHDNQPCPRMHMMVQQCYKRTNKGCWHAICLAATPIHGGCPLQLARLRLTAWTAVAGKLLGKKHACMCPQPRGSRHVQHCLQCLHGLKLLHAASCPFHRHPCHPAEAFSSS